MDIAGKIGEKQPKKALNSAGVDAKAETVAPSAAVAPPVSVPVAATVAAPNMIDVSKLSPEQQAELEAVLKRISGKQDASPSAGADGADTASKTPTAPVAAPRAKLPLK